MHDDDYDRGENEQDRWIADRYLYKRMLRVIHQNYVWDYNVVSTTDSSPWKILKLVLVANLYYASVRLFGRFYFNYTTHEDNTMVQGKQ